MIQARHTQLVTFQAVFTLHHPMMLSAQSASWQNLGQLQDRCGHGELVLSKKVEHKAGAKR
eukprot:477800-Rhodomonas_salina.1